MENLHLLCRYVVSEYPCISSANVEFEAFNLAFIPIIYFFYPETQNLTLEQIDKLFSGDKVMLHWHPSMDSEEIPSGGLRATYEKGEAAQHKEEVPVKEKDSL
jgi:hypothetical protein